MSQGREKPAGAWRARLLSRRWLSPSTFEISLRRPEGFSFVAGQHIRLREGRTERDYSVVSATGAKELTLCIRHVPGVGLSDDLGRRDLETDVSFTGPHGQFTYRRSTRRPVFVATGTGIAPFVAMVRDGVRGFTLLHGVGAAGELLYREEMARAAASYVACVTRSDADGTPPPAPAPFRGRVTAYLAHELPLGEYDFYLCGGTEMIRDATLVADERFRASRVYYESFF